VATHASSSRARTASDKRSTRSRGGRRKTDSSPSTKGQVIRLEIYGILILAFAAALFLALITFNPADIATAGMRTGKVHNAIGPIGAHVANLFLGGVGLGAFALCGTLGFLGLSYIIGRRSHLTRMDVLGWLGVLLGSVILVHVMFAPARLFGHLPGGIAGEYTGEVLRAFLSTPGTLLAATTIIVIAVITLTRRSLLELCQLSWRGMKVSYAFLKRVMTEGDSPEDSEIAVETAEAPRKTKRRKSSKRKETPPEEPPEEVAEHADDESDDDVEASHSEPAEGSVADLVAELVDPPREPEATPVDEPKIVVAAKPEPPPESPAPGDELPPQMPLEAESAATPDDDALEFGPDDLSVADAPEPAADSPAEDDIKIVESAAMRRKRDDLVVAEQLRITDLTDEKQVYELPSVQLLDYRPPDNGAFDRAALRENAQILERTLEDYKVKGKVVEIHPGPVVTMYEFQPAPGIKISKIAGLSDDLAMALSALRIRIVAPIPGKNVVGIEVPNAAREIVYLKEIISDGSYRKSKSKLTLAIGKDIVGNPYVLNLAKAPHMLVAGATGSGKSVAINTFICSLLYNASPEDVRLIMVDPKMLELSIYEGIPHLLLPVVTDPKQATVALRWAVKEMERRYRLMADLGVRNLAGYNKKVLSLQEDPDQSLPERLRLAKVKREARGEVDPDGVVLDTEGKPLEKLPFIVVIVDELADLMMVASKEVEHSIARLAQMARASGIHLILATQRPSVDVITGLIKANFPTRMSFQVASKVDSRTILDTGGAQNLLGMGDMLVMPPGTSTCKRVHGAYVSEEEVHKIVEHLKTQGQPDYDLGILVHEEDEGSEPEKRGDDYDEFYDRAVRIVAETRNASISFLQRKLKIGYNRSARIVEKLEEEGIVGPSDGTSRPREVFIDPI